jgi:hypothetical protein
MDIETIELFKKSYLPKKGWIQGCFYCQIPTSLTTHITTISNNHKTFKFDCYLCKDCKIIFKKNQILYYNFLKDCKIYIYNKYNNKLLTS